MTEKEPAEKSGANKRTIDNYLTENSSIPSVDAAYKIAQASDVSIEQLMQDKSQIKSPPEDSDSRTPLSILKKLTEEEFKMIYNLVMRLSK